MASFRRCDETGCMLSCRRWNAFRTDIDEDMIKETADLMVSLGLRDAG
jgi:hypothetical protein